jgi:hypothetical protein
MRGKEFYDYTSGQFLLYVDDGGAYNGWLCYKHPDGQWVTLRKATKSDLEILKPIIDGVNLDSSTPRSEATDELR